MAPSGKRLVKKSKKSDSQSQSDKKKRSKPVKDLAYGRYVRKVIPADSMISKSGMEIADSFVKDMFERIAGEAGRLTAYSKKKTMDASHVIAAVKMVLPKGLAQQTMMSGARAISNYEKTLKKVSSKKK
eukprot:TRINITY_DN4069_c0_g1_i1.p1 TRINITY_DN4069_c0_g1~~TRINITY_DN4069_c0_g1_i1.p1  ORF type:complete len:129 (+),score=34.32 TRINITY_DN4069_c0_g1_i1:49-435(+)